MPRFSDRFCVPVAYFVNRRCCAGFLLMLVSLLLPITAGAVSAWVSTPSADYNGSFTVSWGAHGDGGTYAVLYQRFNGGSWVGVTQQGYGSHSRTITVTESGTYQFKLEYGWMEPCSGACAPVSKSGSTAIKSTVVQLEPPSPPTVSTSSVSACSTSMTVSWSPGSGYPSGVTRKYDVQESTNSGSTWSNILTNTTATSTSRSLPSNSINYQYRVWAYFTGSGGTSAKSSTTKNVSKGWCPPGAPGTPTLSQPTPTSSTNVSVSWAAASGTVHGYRLQRRDATTASSWTNIYTGSSTSHTDVGAKTRGHTYQYRVLAYNGVDGPTSTVSSVYVPYAPPPAPNLDDSVGGAAGYNGVYNINWSSAGGAVAGFKFQQAESASATPVAGDWTATIIEDIPGNSPQTRSYDQPANFSGAIRYYHYRVKAYNADAEGGWVTVSVAQNYYPQPGAVDTFEQVGMATAAGSYTLRWEPPSGDEDVTHYKLDRLETAGVEYPNIADTGQTQYTQTLTGGASGQTYHHAIQACFQPNEPGAEEACSGYTGTLPVYIPYSVPSTPANFTGPDGSLDGSFEITWSPSTSGTVDHYELEETVNGSSNIINRGMATSFSRSGVNGHYEFRVRACSPDADGPLTPAQACSPWSAKIGFNAFTTPAEFEYSLNDTSFLPNLGDGELVALTQGKASVSNGAAQYTVPIELPPAVNGLKPELALNYNSRGGNGLLGVGWSLSGFSTIRRCSLTVATEGANAQDSNPKYTTADRLCLDNQKLVLASGPQPAGDSAYWASGAEYRTEIDSFAKIQAFGAHDYFKVWTRDGRILTYGLGDAGQNSRIYAPGQPGGSVSVWALDKVEDRYHNAYTIHYQRNTADGDYYPTHIDFSPGASVVFSYIERDANDSDMDGYRSDVPYGYDSGHLHRHPKLLDKITTYIGSGSTAVREYDINYERSATTHRYLVSDIKECGFEGTSPVCAAPLTFEWQTGELGFDMEPVRLLYTSGETIAGGNQAADIDNDGYVDLRSVTAVRWGTDNHRFENTPLIAGNVYKSTALLMTRHGPALIGADDDPVYFGVAELERALSQVNYTQLSSSGVDRYAVLDMNNDGLEDVLTAGTLWIQQTADPVSFIPYSQGESLNTTEVSFTDFNGDGLEDYLAYDKAYRNTGGNQFEYAFDLPLSDSGSVTLYMSMYGTSQPFTLPGSQYRSTLDVNGDGKADLMYHRIPDGATEGLWYLRMNTENGFGPEIDIGISSGSQKNQYSYPYDWDKDGRQDLIIETPDNAAWRILLSGYNNGQPSFSVLNVDPFAGRLIDSDSDLSEALAGLYISVPHAQIFRGDFNNDGVVDLFYWNGSGVTQPWVWYGKQQQPDLLKTITNGFGANMQWQYSPLVQDDNNGKPLYTPSAEKPVFPQRHARRNVQVVKKLSVSDGQGGYHHRYFNYTGAREDAQGRGFLGFEKIEITDTRKDMVTTTTYLQDFPYIGNVARVEVKDSNGKLIGITDYDYAAHTDNGRFPYLKSSIQRQYGLTTIGSGYPVSVTKTENTFDIYGTLTDQTITTGTGLSGETVTDVKRVVTVDNTDITNNTTDWLLGFVEARTETVTDGANPRTVTTEFDPEPGTLDVQVRRDFVGTPVWETTTTTRNTNGLVTEIAVQAGDIDNGTAVTRNTTWGGFTDTMYPGTQTNDKGHATTLGYDVRFGTVSSQIDPNTLTATRDYDALGRLNQETAPDGTVTAIKRYYCATAPVTCPADAVYLSATEVTNGSATGQLGAPLTLVYYDKLQREIRHETYSLNGAIIKVDTEYHADGRVYRVSEPYTGVSPSLWTVYSGYDALDRPRNVSGADGGHVHYDYLQEGGLQKTLQTVTVVTPEGSRTQVTARYTNALGQVEQVLDAALTSIDYTYDTQGNLKTTTVNDDPATTVTVVHDEAGNKTYINDPDAGEIYFDYNGFGELRRQTWQKNTAHAKSIVYDYDTLGRKIKRTDTPVTGSPVIYTWTWDTLKKGLLTSRTGNGFTETYAYNGQARLTSQETSITGLGSRAFSYTYDAFGRPQTVTYPGGFKVEYQYHAAGMQAQNRDVTDPFNPKILWTMGEDSDTRGNFTQQRFGNGVITLSSFDIESGQISGIKTGWPTAGGLSGFTGNIQDLTYEFDTLGNLYKRATGRTNIHGTPEEYTAEFFGYDDLNRLKTSETTWLGIGERNRSYKYDLLGNLTYRSDIGTLTYDQSNNAGVHAVTSANGKSYQYDAYGNMIERGAVTVDYDVFNKPTRIGSTAFSYGPDHARFKQVNGNRTTYYINGGLYEEVVEGGVTTTKSYIGGYLVRSKEADQISLTYLHKDHLGSV
ncbi:MAG TPA: SpvB/TcaC N-terminal domain-containing protein, partial [Gammaproteobacteria bacterium]